MSNERIGVIGLGNMGSAITEQIIKSDFKVIGYDKDDAALQSAMEQGGTAAKSVGEVAGDVDLLLTSLPNPNIVEAVYLGEDGIIANSGEELIVIEASTIDPDTTRKLASEAEEKSVEIIDAPVSGGVGRAKEGNLTIMGGGNKTVFESDSVQELLSAFSSEVHYCGELGAGHTMKLLNNTLSMMNGVAAMETAALAAELNVDWMTFMDVISTSGGASLKFKKGLPKVLNRDFKATFTSDLRRKDGRLAMELADTVDFPVDMARLAYKYHVETVAKGYGDESGDAVIKVFEENIEGRVESEQEIDEDYMSWKDR